MQAGVPVVPIVIHNALDVQPKGESVFRPATVYVEVLAPIVTTSWNARTIDKHITDVRALFLRALGQPEEAAQPRRRAPRKTSAKTATRHKATRT